MPDEPDDDDLTPEEEDKFARFLAKHEDAKAREASRKKPPKDFAEAADRISDLVLEKLDLRAEARRKERDEADETPDRDSGGGGFLKMLGG